MPEIGTPGKKPVRKTVTADVRKFNSSCKLAVSQED
jgi:hypothetical protein